MSEKPSRRRAFHWKGFVTFVLAGVFVLLVTSGAVLYSSPRGRIANWTEWYVLGLNKETWAAVHMATSFLFIVFGGLHLWLNWTSFASYFKVRFERAFNLKVEFALAVVVLALTTAGAVWNLPPVSYLPEWNLAIKDYWEGWSTRPPYPHAEESTLAELAERLGLELNLVVERLDREGLTPATEEDTVADIAASYGVRPEALYRVIMGEPASLVGHGRGGGGRGRGMGSGFQGGGGPGAPVPDGADTNGHAGGQVPGAGFGRRTVEQICAEEGVAVEDALVALEAAGVAAERGDAIRDVAERSGLRPREIAELIAAIAP